MAMTDIKHSIKLTLRYSSTSATGTPIANRIRLTGNIRIPAIKFMETLHRYGRGSILRPHHPLAKRTAVFCPCPHKTALLDRFIYN